MNTYANRRYARAGLLLALVAATPGAFANLLVDPGFELNPLDTAGNVLNNFTTYQGIWGVESAIITGAENGVTPPEGVKMLRMTDDGLIATQGFQVTDVTSYAGLIDSGNAIVSASALLNVDASVPAAIGGVTVMFFSAASYGSPIGTPITGNVNPLDVNPNTWETASVVGSIPVGTRWLVTQVAYSNASLIGVDGTIHPGYVDAADLRIVPEPASIGLLALAATALRRGRRGA